MVLSVKVSQLINYWYLGLVAGPSYQPKASVFDELGIRLNNQLSYNLDLLKRD